MYTTVTQASLVSAGVAADLLPHRSALSVFELGAGRDVVAEAAAVLTAPAGTGLERLGARILDREEERRDALLGFGEQVAQVEQRLVGQRHVDEGRRDAGAAAAARATDLRGQRDPARLRRT